MSETAIGNYFRIAFRWQRGRQHSGYDKMLLFTLPWPLPFDSYILRFPEGVSIPPHKDPVQAGRHYRLNIILKLRSLDRMGAWGSHSVGVNERFT